MLQGYLRFRTAVINGREFFLHNTPSLAVFANEFIALSPPFSEKLGENARKVLLFGPNKMPNP